jgi:hypothetical protein
VFSLSRNREHIPSPFLGALFGAELQRQGARGLSPKVSVKGQRGNALDDGLFVSLKCRYPLEFALVGFRKIPWDMFGSMSEDR